MKKETEELLLVIAEGAQQTAENYCDDFEMIENAMNRLACSAAALEDTADIEERLYGMAKEGKSVCYRIHVLSFLAVWCNAAKYYEALQELLLGKNDVTKEAKFFLYYQMMSKQFTNEQLQNEQTQWNQNK